MNIFSALSAQLSSLDRFAHRYIANATLRRYAASMSSCRRMGKATMSNLLLEYYVHKQATVRDPNPYDKFLTDESIIQMASEAWLVYSGYSPFVTGTRADRLWQHTQYKLNFEAECQ